MLLTFQPALLLGQGLVKSGKAVALPTVWVPFAIVAGLGVWPFMGSRTRLGETPVSRVVDGINNLVKRAVCALPKPMKRKAA